MIINSCPANHPVKLQFCLQKTGHPDSGSWENSHFKRVHRSDTKLAWKIWLRKPRNEGRKKGIRLKPRQLRKRAIIESEDFCLYLVLMFAFPTFQFWRARSRDLDATTWNAIQEFATQHFSSFVGVRLTLGLYSKILGFWTKAEMDDQGQKFRLELETKREEDEFLERSWLKKMSVQQLSD